MEKKRAYFNGRWDSDLTAVRLFSIIRVLSTGGHRGEMAVWLKAHDWKSCLRDERNRGSNPRLSARNPPKFGGFSFFMTSLVTSMDIFSEEIGHLYAIFFPFTWECMQIDLFERFRPCMPHHFSDIPQRQDAARNIAIHFGGLRYFLLPARKSAYRKPYQRQATASKFANCLWDLKTLLSETERLYHSTRPCQSKRCAIVWIFCKIRTFCAGLLSTFYGLILAHGAWLLSFHQTFTF